MNRFFSIPPELVGERVDKVLEALAPGLGLRGRRRLCETGRVLLNGRPAGPAVRVRAGQELRLLDDEEVRADSPDGGAETCGLRVVARGEDFAALFKPAGLHSASLAGGGGASAEAALPRVFPDAPQGREPLLCNRLDRQTSGLLLAAFGAAARAAFCAAEDAGQARKTYLAVVRCAPGETPPERAEFAWPLDTADRRRTRVLTNEAAGDARPGDAGPLRRTEVARLCPAGDGLWLVAARILKGARHQIRAHLAQAGLPILGDGLYGPHSGKGREQEADTPLHLHHFRLEIPGFNAETPPPWPLWERLAAEASAELEKLFAGPWETGGG